MPPVPYTKPALSLIDQLQQLKNRGLLVDDDTKAIFLLENISYYRLSGYWYPFLASPKSTHIFKPNSNFDQAFSIYCFDRELRKLVNSEIEKIEVAIRAKMIYTLSHSRGAFWFSDGTIFTNGSQFNNTIGILTTEYSRSQEDFIKAFRLNYTDPLPPSWMLLEIASFGTLSKLFANLRPGLDKRAISQHFGLDENTFESWIHALVYIRNICAHHARLWNKKFHIYPAIPTTSSKQWLNNINVTDTRTGNIYPINNRTYYILSVILYLLQTVSPKNKFREKIFSLFKEYPSIDPAALGFTRDWKEEPLWDNRNWFQKKVNSIKKKWGFYSL